MKKLLVLALAGVLVFSMTGCKSKQQKAADEFIEKMDKLIDDYEDACKDEDAEKAEKIDEKLEKLAEDYEDIYDDLEDKDEDAADDFEDDYMKLAEKYMEIYGTYGLDLDFDYDEY